MIRMNNKKIPDVNKLNKIKKENVYIWDSGICLYIIWKNFKKFYYLSKNDREVYIYNVYIFEVHKDIKGEYKRKEA